MKAPDKLYIGRRNYGPLIGGWESQPFSSKEIESIEYIHKDVLMEWVESEMERLWELLPDADNDNPTEMEIRYLGQYMQMEALEDKLNSM